MKLGTRNVSDVGASIKLGGRNTYGGNKLGGRYQPKPTGMKK